MRIDVLTLFPEMFGPVLDASIIGRARAAGAVEISLVNIRDYTENKHGKVDDRPFGGGPGMVMTCQPLWDAVSATEAKSEVRGQRSEVSGEGDAAARTSGLRVLMTPAGRPLTQEIVTELSHKERLLIIAGHYEGIDERVIEKLNPLELSIGDYVLSGGELPAMVLIDAVVRLLPGVLGHEQSAAEDSFAVRTAQGAIGQDGNPVPPGRPLLDCPHYTRPRVWEGMEVPEVLLSGDHGAVEQWRSEERLKRTRQRRPDLGV